MLPQLKEELTNQSIVGLKKAPTIEVVADRKNAVNNILYTGVEELASIAPIEDDIQASNYTKVHCTTTSVYCRPSKNLP